jgi:hypothetical protein
MIQIFDMVGNKPVPSPHCYLIKEYRNIIEEYPGDYLQVLGYILYTNCLDPTLNPYVNVEESLRETVVIEDIGPLNFSLEDEYVIAAIEKTKKLYETPVDRSFKAAKVMLDKISEDMINLKLTYGQKDGNATIMKGFMEKLPTLWKAYKEMTIELLGEQSIARGKVRRAYDQLPSYKEFKPSEDANGEQEAL